MKVRFTTKTGSTYELDTEAMTWKRLDKTVKSGTIRNEGGQLVEWPTVQVGSSVRMFDTAVRPGYAQHAVETSEVMSVERE